MSGDACWYEAALVVGITNAVNVVADTFAARGAAALLPPVDEAGASDDTRALFDDIRRFYAAAEVPFPFRLIARDPGYAADVWAAVRRAFEDNRLSRRLKEA